MPARVSSTSDIKSDAPHSSARDRRPNHVLVVDCATYHYPYFQLGPIDLAIGRGEIVGLVGPNGSGKSTLLSLIVGRRRPSGGRIRIGDELDPVDPATRRVLGYVPDSVDEVVAELTAVELWRVHALAHLGRSGIADAQKRATDLADLLDFSPPAQPINTYSHGMRRKTQMIAAALHRPGLLVLDEPTNGLDPLSAYRLGTLAEAAASGGAGVLVATHDLAWAQRFSHRVAAISRGRLVAVGTTCRILPEGESLLDRFLALVEDADQ